MNQDDEISVLEFPNLKSLKKRPDVIERIKFDVTPQMVMEPRFKAREGDLEKLSELTGYGFYIETQCEPPALMIMKIGKADIFNTVGIVEEIPTDMIKNAIEKPSYPPSYGMYAISEDIKTWLRKELEL